MICNMKYCFKKLFRKIHTYLVINDTNDKQLTESYLPGKNLYFQVLVDGRIDDILATSSDISF